jgi:peptidoglycan hydrolase-like protein with peptidoglycan-binding domain
VGKATGVALIVMGVAILIGAYLLPQQGADLIHHELVPLPSDIANASGPLAGGDWRLYAAKTEEAVVVTLPSNPRPTTPQQVATVNPHDKAALARELQSELKRAGCYHGEINGVWTGSTRHAMKAFMGRVNAALPTDLPDSILLTLVRSYPEKVCGEPCPQGQRLADGDRCVLMALVAQPKKAPQQGAPGLITDWTTKTTVARAPLVDQGEGAMALGGPVGGTPAAPAANAVRPQRPSVAFKPTASSSRRFGVEIFRKLDRFGNY